MIELITQRDLIRGVAEKWRRQYSKSSYWETPNATGRTAAQVAARLDALDVETATHEDVAKIIGNDSWTELICNSCRADCERVVQVGEPDDYESRTANLCLSCARKAVEAFGGGDEG